MRARGTQVPPAVRNQTMMNNPWRKILRTPHGDFPSVKEASRVLGISVELIGYRCRRGAQQRAARAQGKKEPGYCDFSSWEKINPAGRERGIRRGVATPDGEFASVKAAAQHYGITSSALINRIVSDHSGYRYLDQEQ